VIFTADSAAPNGWDPAPGYPDPGTNVTLNPGEAAFYDNLGGAPITFTFVGTVPQGTNTVQLSTGFNLVSSVVPQAGGLTSVLGFPVASDFSQDGDLAYVYSNPGGYTIYTADSAAPSKWDAPPGEPSIAVGTGFFYLAQGPVTWTRVFSVNQ